MEKFKLLSDVKVVYFAETIQAQADIDGEVVTFRYFEDSNGSEFFILDKQERWVATNDEKYDCLSNACGALELTKDSKAGDEFYFE